MFACIMIIFYQNKSFKVGNVEKQLTATTFSGVCLLIERYFLRALRHSRSARAEVPDWELGIRPREEMMVNLTYCMAKTTGLNVNSLVLDIVKSYDRKAYRSDGLLPPFTS